MKTGLLDPDYRQRLLAMRLAATVLLLAADAWAVGHYLEFQKLSDKFMDVFITGSVDIPRLLYAAEYCGVWPVVVTTAGGIAGIIYIWGFARSILSVLIATAYSGAFCGIVGGLYRLAAVDSRHFG